MNNQDVYDLIADCLSELRRVKKIVDRNRTNELAKFLTNYAIIRASGTIEQGYKTLIADRLTRNKKSHRKLKIFVDNNVRKSSATANKEVIVKFLTQFDDKFGIEADKWGKTFTGRCNSSPHSANIDSSFKNLSLARNTVAHGRSTTMSIDQVLDSFKYCRKSLKFLDDVLE